MIKFASIVGPILAGGAVAAGIVTTYTLVSNEPISTPNPDNPGVTQQVIESNDYTDELLQPAQEDAGSVVTDDFVPALEKQATAPRVTISGTYRCWSYNVSGGSGTCRIAPPIVINADGTYSMSSENGTYIVSGDTIVLSESKIRGPGTLLEDGMQIRFEYDYNGWQHTVTYLKQEAGGSLPSKAESSALPVYLDLTIKFSEPYDGIDYINTVALQDQNGGIMHEALTYAEDDQTLRAYYKPSRGGVPGGAIYSVSIAGSTIGSIDLREAQGETSRTVSVSSL